MPDEVTLTIDGRTVTVPAGTLLVEACRMAGSEVPVYCYHPAMEPLGACRICVVHLEGQRRPIQTACTTRVAEGMVVNTRSPEADRARQGILEFLLINHPLDCPVCDRGGECDLQDFTLRYGPERSRYREARRHFPKSEVVGRDIVLDRERCIMCMRCVRFCREIAMEEGLVITERGGRSAIDVFEGRPYDSNFSGNTVELCPVGALTARTYRFRARPWELQHHDGLCSECSLGCNLTVDVRFGEVVRLRSRRNPSLDDGWLCDQGRTGHLRLQDRLLRPRIRREGELAECSWEEALQEAARGFREVLEAHGPEAIGAVAGPRLNNEGGWLLVRLLRGLLGSPHLDHRRGPLRDLPLSATVAGLDEAEAVVVAGCCPTTLTPVLDLRIKKALRRGAKLVVAGEEPTLLDRYAHFRLKGPLSETLERLLEGLGPAPGSPPERSPAVRPWEAGGASSTDPDEAARFLAGCQRVTAIFSETLEDEAALAHLRELVRAAGCENRPPWGLLCLHQGCNSRGLREMGVLPVPGPAEGLERVWGSYDGRQGRDYLAAVASPPRAFLVVLDDPLPAGPDPEHLVVVDHFLTDTARRARVVLPASSPFEQTLTYTATDGTVQLGGLALPPAPDSRPVWRILTDLAEALGQRWPYTSPADVFAEIGRHHPRYRGMTYAAFRPSAGVHWSYPITGRLGTPRPDLAAIPVRDPAGLPWRVDEAVGTAVESVARVLRGEKPPAVPGQEDPREVAARLSLDRLLAGWPGLEPGKRQMEGGPLGPQPPGPNPAWRFHRLGVGPRRLVEEPAGSRPPVDGEEPSRKGDSRG